MNTRATVSRICHQASLEELAKAGSGWVGGTVGTFTVAAAAPSSETQQKLYTERANNTKVICMFI